jgi:hypothetical protein
MIDAVKTFARSTPFAEDNIRDLATAAMDLQLDRLIAADVAGVPEPTDTEAVTLVDGTLTGTEDELADVVESIVAEQVARLMAGR